MSKGHGFGAGNQPRYFWLAGAAALLPATSAQAHTTFPGMGEFASGFLHPLTTPLHLLIWLALGLWLGQQAPLRLRAPAAIFAAAAACGLVLTVVARFGGVSPPVLAALGLFIAVGVASALPVPFWMKLGTCGVAALAVGLDSGVDAGTPGASAVKILFATWVSLILCLVNVTFYVSLLPAVRWVQIGVRVLGSWIVAIALLLLAFALRS